MNTEPEEKAVPHCFIDSDTACTARCKAYLPTTNECRILKHLAAMAQALSGQARSAGFPAPSKL